MPIGKPQPNFDLVRPALPTLAQLIYSPDDDVLTDACWALSVGRVFTGSHRDMPYYTPTVPSETLAAHTPTPIPHHQPQYLSDGPNEKIQAVIEAGVCRRLVELLMHHSPSVQTPALRTVGNIVTGDDLQTQIIINFSALVSSGLSPRGSAHHPAHRTSRLHHPDTPTH